MPLSKTAKEVKKSMQEQYGKKKGAQVFHATAAKKGGEPERAKTWKKKAKKKGTVKEFVISQDTEIILDGNKYLLEKGDKIVVESTDADAAVDLFDAEPVDLVDTEEPSAKLIGHDIGGYKIDAGLSDDDNNLIITIETGDNIVDLFVPPTVKPGDMIKAV